MTVSQTAQNLIIDLEKYQERVNSRDLSLLNNNEFQLETIKDERFWTNWTKEVIEFFRQINFIKGYLNVNALYQDFLDDQQEITFDEGVHQIVKELKKCLANKSEVGE